MKDTTTKRSFSPVAVWNGKEVYFVEDTPKQYNKPVVIPTLEQWKKENSMRCAISVLKAVYYSSLDNKVKEMYYGLLADKEKIDNPKIGNYAVSDGYDVFLEVYIYLSEMAERGYYDLFTAETVELTMSKGKKKMVSLFQAMCYKARHYIYNHGQVDFKTVYIEDLTRENKEGEKLNCYDALDGLMKVAQYYDIDNELNYRKFEVFRKSLNLTVRQKQILHYRLKGLSVNEIAERLNVRQNTISSHLAVIQKEVRAKYPAMVRFYHDKRKRNTAVNSEK